MPVDGVEWESSDECAHTVILNLFFFAAIVYL